MSEVQNLGFHRGGGGGFSNYETLMIFFFFFSGQPNLVFELSLKTVRRIYFGKN